MDNDMTELLSDGGTRADTTDKTLGVTGLSHQGTDQNNSLDRLEVQTHPMKKPVITSMTASRA